MKSTGSNHSHDSLRCLDHLSKGEGEAASLSQSSSLLLPSSSSALSGESQLIAIVSFVKPKPLVNFTTRRNVDKLELIGHAAIVCQAVSHAGRENRMPRCISRCDWTTPGCNSVPYWMNHTRIGLFPSCQNQDRMGKFPCLGRHQLVSVDFLLWEFEILCECLFKFLNFPKAMKIVCLLRKK